MTSILKVDSIAQSNGTTAATINSSGQVTFPQAVTFTQPLTPNPQLAGSKVSLNGLANKDFTIPAGTNRFTITLDAAEGPSNGYLCARLGTSGGIISANYLSHNSNFQSSSSGYGGASENAFRLTAWSNDNADITGTMTFTHHGNNVWLMDAPIISPYYPTYFIGFRGKISLGAECTTVRIFPNTGNFDGGDCNLLFG